MKIRFYLSHNFVGRSSLRSSIARMLNVVGRDLKKKKVLDIGCGSKPYTDLFEIYEVKYFGIDFRNHSINNSFQVGRPDIYFPRHYSKNFLLSNLKNESFDMITAFQVLEHHERPDIFFMEVSRLLKKGGYLLLTFPFVWALHEEPNDFQRLTEYQIEKLSKKNGLKVIRIERRGSVLSLMSQIFNLSLFNSKFPIYIKYLIYFPILLPMQYCAHIYDFISHSRRRKIFLSYTFLIRK